MSWYDSAGNESDLVLASFVTVIRSIEGFAFGDRMSSEDHSRLTRAVLSSLAQMELSPLALSSLEPAALRVLAEKGFIDAEPQIPSSLLLLDEERGLSIVIGGKEHIKLRAMLPGLALEEALETLLQPERLIDSSLELAFSEQLGYLTEDLSFLGTAASFSLLMHLPTSDKSSITELGRFITAKPLPGDLMLLTSPPFPGITEAEQCERLMLAEKIIAERERSSRAALKRVSHSFESESEQCLVPQQSAIGGSRVSELSDRAMRAYGILSNARLMSFEEFMPLWSSLRLGAISGLSGLPSPEELGGLLISALPACLPPDGDPRARRAELLRRRLSMRTLSGIVS